MKTHIEQGTAQASLPKDIAAVAQLLADQLCICFESISKDKNDVLQCLTFYTSTLLLQLIYGIVSRMNR
ncbi:hypothetical protein chiPu_0002276 [Chiloscyllium punctatum]|uniref:Uncharacterized protein n=1 Tax=Chiloscyllium punctatum TaxID=137246 RepID=A0A401S0J1_CHIPU|nr:hypothetical protein [Chiloscyllium punctatum]